MSSSLVEEIGLPGAAAAQSWKSLRSGRINWNHEQVLAIASSWRSQLPADIEQVLIRSQAANKPMKLVAIRTRRILWRDVEQNSIWISAIVEAWPCVVPSLFCIADSFLELDRQLNGNLLTATGSSTKADLAQKEACKLKKLAQHARALFRNGDESQHPGIKKIKSLMRAKPQSRRPRTVGAQLALPTCEGGEEEEEQGAEQEDAREEEEEGEELLHALDDGEPADEVCRKC